MSRLLLLGVTAILAAGVGIKLALNQQAVSVPAPTTTAPSPSRPVQTPISSSQPPAMAQSSSSLPSVMIQSCDGIPSGANFRFAPTLAQWAILGEIQVGQRVYLTGQTVRADGKTWHEAISPGAIPDPGKTISPNQPGWVASCFVQN